MFINLSQEKPNYEVNHRKELIQKALKGYNLRTALDNTLDRGPRNNTKESISMTTATLSHTKYTAKTNYIQNQHNTNKFTTGQ